MTSIASLPDLILRLKDPSGASELYLDDRELSNIVEYHDIEDFAEVYSQFIAAIKANTAIKELSFDYHQPDKRLLPIVNPLCRHLNAESVSISLAGESHTDSILHYDIQRFRNVRISDGNYEYNRPLLHLNPDLEVFRYYNDGELSQSLLIGPRLLDLPYPSNLRELELGANTFDNITSDDLNVSMADRFNTPQLNRLVDFARAPSLQKLSLRCLVFPTYQDCIKLARGLEGSSVRELCLELFSADSGNFGDLASALAKMQNLETLYLQVRLDRSEGDVRGFSLPFGDIVKAPCLKSLSFGQHWKLLDANQCEDLAKALQAPSCRLEHLDISGDNPVGLGDLAKIMSSFSSPVSRIKSFSASFAASGSDDVDAWLLKLPKSATLTRLDLSTPDAVYWGNRNCRFTKSQGKKLVRILRRWYNLEACFVRVLDHDSKIRLETLLRLNKAGRGYLMSSSPSQQDGVEVLVKVRGHLDDLYTHIRENPTLCDLLPAADSRPLRAKKARHT